jgi:hypothetical protein
MTEDRKYDEKHNKANEDHRVLPCSDLEPDTFERRYGRRAGLRRFLLSLQTAYGNLALNGNGGVENTAVGDNALGGNTGNDNTGVGVFSLLNSTGNNNTAIGVTP